MVNKPIAARVTPRLSAYLYIMHVDQGVSVRKLSHLHPQYSLATIHRHATKKIWSEQKRQCIKTGRPKKINPREQRNLIRQLYLCREQEGNFTSARLQYNCNLMHVSNKTVRRTLHQSGFKYLQSRKKGLMSKQDLVKRVKFVKDMHANYNETVWQEEICFYFDGSSFVHKTNPCEPARTHKGRVWRKYSEGLKQGCTSKGSKAGHGGSVVHLFVAISFGKGICFCEPYEKLSGSFVASFVHKHFKNIFTNSCNRNGKIFIQDGDPSQNSKAARKEIARLGYVQLKIPPRSPDLNPIENVFNHVQVKLCKDALQQRITHETYAEFKQRIIQTMLAFPVENIDRVILSMPKRIKELLKNKGDRLKY